MTKHDTDGILIDLRYAVRQLREFRDVDRALGALERIEETLAKPKSDRYYCATELLAIALEQELIGEAPVEVERIDGGIRGHISTDNKGQEVHYFEEGAGYLCGGGATGEPKFTPHQCSRKMAGGFQITIVSADEFRGLFPAAAWRIIE